VETAKIANYQLQITISFDSQPPFCFPYDMELRKDPITRSWVITGDEVIELTPRSEACRFCGPAAQPAQIIATLPGLEGGAWSTRSVVHPHALYHIEGEPARRGDGLYDRMGTVGAHEVLLENPRHDGHLWSASEAEVEQFLRLAAQRIQDLKRDARFRYISVFKNFGPASGREFDHPNSELTATTFIPRRVLYELRAGLDYYHQKERCVFCDIVAQETTNGQRIIEVRGDFVAMCPYAARAPYETWILARSHDSSYEHYALSRPQAIRDLAGLLKRTLQRIRSVTESFHMVLHTSPNKSHASASLGYWKTLDEDYHWHIEILPILAAKAKSYTFKEVYYSPVTPETSARRLREAPVEI
jgi:UDPglucose--hexose-1-phosphate uridylyltransferase